jgi:hypothetical protein
MSIPTLERGAWYLLGDVQQAPDALTLRPHTLLIQVVSDQEQDGVCTARILETGAEVRCVPRPASLPKTHKWGIAIQFPKSRFFDVVFRNYRQLREDEIAAYAPTPSLPKRRLGAIGRRLARWLQSKIPHR